MSRVTGKNLEIECPECGEIIDINEQISHQLQEETANQKKQLEIRIKKELQASHSVEIENISQNILDGVNKPLFPAMQLGETLINMKILENWRNA